MNFMRCKRINWSGFLRGIWNIVFVNKLLCSWKLEKIKITRYKFLSIDLNFVISYTDYRDVIIIYLQITNRY